ncbi:hypothetical protein KIJ05_06205 [Leuconostoc gelidum subsp. gasicomitatum]|uniref:hypothetical protein n=1 Tax=Leuconostoc gasicomitatum TaxID=115778 RepID=UPI001CC64EA7|nr:hypothetical protein [Leuconostoc gasicomitatum]MBZ5984708.1 hypothetical protein [Leuconostoc gasicomitatum]
MFKKLFATPQHGMSDEDYSRLAKYQIDFVSIIFIILAIFLFALILPIYYFYGHKLGSFASGLYSGLFAGAISIKLWSVIYLSNPHEVHRRKIKDTDERVQQVRQRADALTLKILLVIAYLTFILGLSYFTEYYWYLATPIVLILILQFSIRWLFTKLL